MADSSDSVVSNNTNNCKDLCAVQSSDKIEDNRTDKVMEPILVDEYTHCKIPQTINNVINYLKKVSPSSSRDDILVCLIYLLILECGFVPKEEYNVTDKSVHSFNYKEILRLSKKLPANWKTNNMYTFKFILPPFDSHDFTVVCVNASDDIVINGVINYTDAQFAVCLDPLLYFSASRCDVNNFHLQNVKHLSIHVKDWFINPAKYTILYCNRSVTGTVDNLPTEILLLIIRYLDVKSLVRFGRLNSVCNGVIKTPNLWINLLLKDFPQFSKKNNLTDLNKASYEKVYKLYKDFYGVPAWRSCQ